MKALTIWQPWASLIVHGRNRVENRTRATSFRGQFLIHAGKLDREACHYVGLQDAGYSLERLQELPTGAIIGIATLLGVLPVSEYQALSFDPFAFGPYCWVLGDVKPLGVEIPLRGQRGLFDLPDDVAAQAIRSVIKSPLDIYVQAKAEKHEKGTGLK